MKKYTVGFIGYGNMSQAIVAGLTDELSVYLLKDAGFKLKITVSDPDNEKLAKAPKCVVTTSDNVALVHACDVIVLAIKPQMATEVMRNLDFTGKIVISIMASVSTITIEKLTGHTTDKIVRVMPNLNARAGSAYSTYCTAGLDNREAKLVENILYSFGDARKVDEKYMNTTTGIGGSGPAFAFMFLEAYYNAALNRGIPNDVALEMAVSTIRGSANLIEETYQKDGEYSKDKANIDELVKSVCSKGGTTIEGVNYLNENGFENIVVEAIERAIVRAEEMGKANEER